MTNKQSTPAFKRRCQVCGATFLSVWKVTRFCSGTCRKRSSRAHRELSEIDVKIEAARKRYWALVRKKEIGLNVKNTRVPTNGTPPRRRKAR
jgi:hypothetical protein